MKTVKIVYWQDEEKWIGHLFNHPDYITQGESLDELKENLQDIFNDIDEGHIPNVRTVEEMVIP